jgi:hypothetical protein
MGKVIFGLVIAAIVWVLFFFSRKKRLGSSASKINSASPANPAGHSTASPEIENMVTCTTCGVNLPASEAVRDANGSWQCVDGNQCNNAKR